MTLAELAALAAEKVPDFKRLVRLERWVAGERCVVWNDSPAALLMAVAVCASVAWVGPVSVGVQQGGPGASSASPGGYGDLRERTPESIARAALVALLRAHGVEVDDE